MVPDGWQYIKIAQGLDKVIDYRGKAPPKANEGVRLITARNVRMGYLDLTHKEFIDRSKYSVWMNRGIPKSGDVLFTTEAPLGNACIFSVEGKVAIGQRIITLRANNETLITGFLFYLLLSNHGQHSIYRRSSGSTATGIKSKEFLKIDILVPPIIEQKEIAKILSTWGRAIEVTEKLITNSRQQKKSLMQQLLTGKKRISGFNGKWKAENFGNLTKIYDGTHTTPKYVEKGIPFYSVEHLTSNNFSNTKFISEEVFYKENKRVKLEKGDILMTRIGDIGTAKHLSWDVEASFYVSLALIKSNNNFSSEFLSYYIAGENFQRELWKRIIHVAFPKKINLGEIGNCIVFLPSLEEQEIIASVLSAADRDIAVLQRKLDFLKQEKKALMQQLLTGKRRVKIDEEDMLKKEVVRA